jgi:hypothetical protein
MAPLFLLLLPVAAVANVAKMLTVVVTRLRRRPA